MINFEFIKNLLSRYSYITDINEFDAEYAEYLEEGFMGLEFEDPVIVAIVSIIFETWFTKMPNFMYFQIKPKFNYVCVYTNLPGYMNTYLEHIILYLLTLRKKDPEKYKTLIT